MDMASSRPSARQAPAKAGLRRLARQCPDVHGNEAIRADDHAIVSDAAPQAAYNRLSLVLIAVAVDQNRRKVLRGEARRERWCIQTRHRLLPAHLFIRKRRDN